MSMHNRTMKSEVKVLGHVAAQTEAILEDRINMDTDRTTRSLNSPAKSGPFPRKNYYSPRDNPYARPESPLQVAKQASGERKSPIASTPMASTSKIQEMKTPLEELSEYDDVFIAEIEAILHDFIIKTTENTWSPAKQGPSPSKELEPVTEEEKEMAAELEAMMNGFISEDTESNSRALDSPATPGSSRSHGPSPRKNFYSPWNNPYSRPESPLEVAKQANGARNSPKASPPPPSASQIQEMSMSSDYSTDTDEDTMAEQIEAMLDGRVSMGTGNEVPPTSPVDFQMPSALQHQTAEYYRAQNSTENSALENTTPSPMSPVIAGPSSQVGPAPMRHFYAPWNSPPFSRPAAPTGALPIARHVEPATLMAHSNPPERVVLSNMRNSQPNWSQYQRVPGPSTQMANPQMPCAIVRPSNLCPVTINGRTMFQITRPIGTTSNTAQAAVNRDKPYIKKPPNAFMLYKAEQRELIMQEFNITNSAEVNKIAGARWTTLSDNEQAPYFEQARVAKREHEAKFPEWSARDNFGRKKRKSNATTPAAYIHPAAPAGPAQSLWNYRATMGPLGYNRSVPQMTGYTNPTTVPTAPFRTVYYNPEMMVGATYQPTNIK